MSRYSFEVQSIRELQQVCEQLLDRIKNLEHRMNMFFDDLYKEKELQKKRLDKLEEHTNA